MKRHIFLIVWSVFVILLSSFFIFYIYWDLNQPKIGPMGNGPTAPTFIQMLPIYCALMLGILNLAAGIYRYNKYKREQY